MKRTVLAKLITVGLFVALLSGLIVALPGSVAQAVVNSPDYCILSGVVTPSEANGTYYRGNMVNGRPEYVLSPGSYTIGYYATSFSRTETLFRGLWLRAFTPLPSQWYIKATSPAVNLFSNSSIDLTPPAAGWLAIIGTGTPSIVCGYGTPPSTEPLPTPEPAKSPVTFVYGDGKQVNLSCKKTLSYDLIVPGGDMAILSCPISGLGSNNKLTQEELPGGLPGGTFVAGMDVEISGGGTPMILTPGPWIVTFKMPEGATAGQLAILFWDKDNNQWVELPAAVNLLTDKFTDLGNGRKVLVGTHQYTRTHVSATINFTGTFVLIKK